MEKIKMNTSEQEGGKNRKDIYESYVEKLKEEAVGLKEINEINIFLLDEVRLLAERKIGKESDYRDEKTGGFILDAMRIAELALNTNMYAWKKGEDSERLRGEAHQAGDESKEYRMNDEMSQWYESCNTAKDIKIQALNFALYRAMYPENGDEDLGRKDDYPTVKEWGFNDDVEFIR